MTFSRSIKICYKRGKGFINTDNEVRSDNISISEMNYLTKTRTNRTKEEILPSVDYWAAANVWIVLGIVAIVILIIALIWIPSWNLTSTNAWLAWVLLAFGAFAIGVGISCKMCSGRCAYGGKSAQKVAQLQGR